MAPIFHDAQHAGMACALQELLNCIVTDSHPNLYPSWLWSGHWKQTLVKVHDSKISMAPLIRHMQDFLKTPGWERTPFPAQQERQEELQQVEMNVCIARLEFGAMLERIAMTQWTHTKRLDRRARVVHLSFMAAWWTSIHAQHAECLLTGNILNAEPTIHNVPTQGNEYALDHILDERVVCGSSCKRTHTLHQLLVRCTNPATRGWITTLNHILEYDEASVQIIKQAMLVCFTGMHANLCPGERPDWKLRHSMLRRINRDVSHTEMVSLIRENPTATKEAIRRRLLCLLESSIATRHVMSIHGSIIATVGMAPRASLCAGLNQCMLAFVRAGSVYASDTTIALHTTLQNEFQEQHVITKWLHKVLIRHHEQSLLDETNQMHITGFRAHWNAFWSFSTEHDKRPHRLDQHQYDALHAKNPAVVLCQTLNTEFTKRVMQLVLTRPDLAVLTYRDACEHVFESIQQPKPQASISMESLVASGSPTASCAAAVLYAGRLIWLCEQLLIVDLGPKTRRAHSIAIINNANSKQDTTQVKTSLNAELMDETQLTDRLNQLPLHATSLCLCAECKRIANAIPEINTSLVQAQSIQMGVSSTMLSTESMTTRDKQVKLHCARRSSAAHRTAILYSEQAFAKAIDTKHQWEKEVCATSIHNLRTKRVLSTQMRRDGRRVYEQRRIAMSCGETPLVTIPLIGRAIRLNERWFTLCTQCGMVTNISNINRIKTTIVCINCYSENLLKKTQLMHPDNSLSRDRICRFCAKAVQFTNARGTPFSSYLSPHDTFGSNRTLPKELRVTWWCNLHQRHWLSSALTCVATNVILSHIAENAKPVFSASETELLQMTSTSQNKRLKTVKQMRARAYTDKCNHSHKP